MYNSTDDKLDLITLKIETAETLIKAIIECFCGIETLNKQDGKKFIFLLENCIKDIKQSHNNLVTDFK